MPRFYETTLSITNLHNLSISTHVNCSRINKKVQDPNLVGALSGHVPGSRAFARYRTIDDEMKRELVAAIE